MNQKKFYLFIFLIFALFLSGCNSVIVGNPEIDIELETKRVIDVVHDFWSFINAQDYYNSAWCCTPEGAYNFVEPYFDSIDLLKQICPNVVIDVYAYIRDISFILDESGNTRALVDIQVNRIFIDCDLDSQPPQFGTMELTYCFVGLPYDEGWYIDKLDKNLLDIDF
jgi:hypothetical protein